jgi:hypothetical protein
VSARSAVSIALLVLCCAALAACGSGHKSNDKTIEGALGLKEVAGLFTTGLTGVTDPACTPSAIPGNYHCSAKPVLGPCTAGASGPCDSRLAPARVWFDCFPDTSGTAKWSCQLVPPPAGVSVFTTKALKAAPKHAIWVCKAFNADHLRIGPFLIATTDPHGPTEQRGGYVSYVDARALATRLGLKLTNGC